MTLSSNVIVGFVALMLSGAALGSNWDVQGSRRLDNGSTETFSVDLASFASRGPGIKTVWVEQSNNVEPANAPFAFKSIRFLWAFKCAHKQKSVVSVVFYSKENGRGVVVRSPSYADWKTSWEEISPDSVAEDVLKMACKKA